MKQHAGTFSPNAAFVEAVYPVTAGTTYTFEIVWKTNKPASGATIDAGAGPVSGNFSPTRLTATWPGDRPEFETLTCRHPYPVVRE